MPNTAAPSRSPEHRAGIGAALPGLVEGQQRARTIGVALHHQRVAVDDVGAGVAMAFQRQQLVLVAAQMRGAIQNVGDEGRMAERKPVVVVDDVNQARSCGAAC
jgi:hypothetical protein